jgi:cellobiose phosphorylase
MVGKKGKGESVWLGFFMYEVLMEFTKVAKVQGDIKFAEQCRDEAGVLQQNIERNGWDGEWYLRAYFDDGSPLGSVSNPECKIDSIVQSWSVISGAGNKKRSQLAMRALDERLVRRNNGLIQLLDPPFDKSDLNPGYIKGYVPGVRENGGQYTHAAIWAAMAFAHLGDRQKAWELLTIINPVNHAKSQEGVNIYNVEPYVVAADVYAVSPHIGRGGWTWYTGSAGWMYRLVVESLLGLRLEANKRYIYPCLPADWEKYEVIYKYRETSYNITIIQIHNSVDLGVCLDGVKTENLYIPLTDDRKKHTVQINILQLDVTM